MRKSINQYTVLINTVFIIIIMLVVVLLELISAIFGRKTFFPNIEKDTEVIIVILLFLIIPLFFQNTLYQQKINSSVENTSKHLKNIEIKLAGIGKLKWKRVASEAVLEVEKKIADACRIWNTFIVGKEPFDNETRDSLVNTFCEAAKKPNIKMENIYSDIGTYRIEAIKERNGGRLPNSYEAYIVKPDYEGFPICNYIVLKDQNNSKPEEVYFGWGYYSVNPDQDVFWSDEPHLVDFFKRYHEELKRFCYNYQENTDPDN